MKILKSVFVVLALSISVTAFANLPVTVHPTVLLSCGDTLVRAPNLGGRLVVRVFLTQENGKVGYYAKVYEKSQSPNLSAAKERAQAPLTLSFNTSELVYRDQNKAIIISLHKENLHQGTLFFFGKAYPIYCADNN